MHKYNRRGEVIISSANTKNRNVYFVYKLFIKLPVLMKERKPFVESGTINTAVHSLLWAASAQHNSWHLNSEWSQVHFHFPAPDWCEWPAQQPSSLTEPLYSIKSDKQQQCEAVGGSPLRCVPDIPPWSAEPNSSHYNHQPGSRAIKTSALVSDPPQTIESGQSYAGVLRPDRGGK